MKKISITLYEFLWLNGGGQRVCCQVAEALSKCELFDVTLLTDKPMYKRWFESNFSVDFSNVNVTTERKNCDVYLNCEFKYWGNSPDIGQKAKVIMAHDAHPLGSQPNYLPLYDYLIVNSVWSSSVFKKTGWPLEPNVIYPPIFKPRIGYDNIQFGNKTNTLLVVGRFDHRRNANSFRTVIDAFKYACDTSLNGKKYKMVMAGHVLDYPTYDSLIKQASGYPVEFVEGPSDYSLADLYHDSKYLVNLRGIDCPRDGGFTSQEALGLVTVEAISYGCIPIVFNYAGHKEAIGANDEDGRDICCIDEANELGAKVIELDNLGFTNYVTLHRHLYDYVSKTFGQKRFVEDFYDLIKEKVQ